MAGILGLGLIYPPPPSQLPHPAATHAVRHFPMRAHVCRKLTGACNPIHGGRVPRGDLANEVVKRDVGAVIGQMMEWINAKFAPKTKLM